MSDREQAANLLADEERWSAAFARSQNQLAKLAEKARRDVQAGRFREMGFDELLRRIKDHAKHRNTS